MKYAVTLNRLENTTYEITVRIEAASKHGAELRVYALYGSGKLPLELWDIIEQNVPDVTVVNIKETIE